MDEPKFPYNPIIMENRFTDKLYLKLMEDLQAISNTETDLFKNVTAAVSKVRSAIKTLQGFIETKPFIRIEDEIHFFKHTKPQFYSWLIYHVDLYQIDSAKPKGTSEIIQAYFEGELNFINRFFHQNKFLYEYYRHGMVELDHLYFTPVSQVKLGFPQEIPVLLPEISANCDYLISKFIAYERLSQEILKRLSLLNKPTMLLPHQAAEEKEKLTWTGDKVNIAELAYGLYYTGQINGGSCDVADIIKWLEDSLNLQMGSVHRKFIDIRRRKTISYTKFLDQMREAIQKRVEEDLVYKPNRGIKLQNHPSTTKE